MRIEPIYTRPAAAEKAPGRSPSGSGIPELVPSKGRMIYAKDFLDLQLTFAERVCAWSGLPWERVLLEYTNLYVRLCLGRSFDPGHETWRSYLAGLRGAADAREYTYRCYLRDGEAKTAPPVSGKFGCFSWQLRDAGGIRLHFRNEDANGASPLSAAQMGQRRAELTALFAHVKATVSDATTVIGGSWLYNLGAYRRLFPPAYGDSRRVIAPRFQGMSLWGQLVDHRGHVKPAMAQPFLSALAERSTLSDAQACFPLQVFAAQAPVQEFYAFYGV